MSTGECKPERAVPLALAAALALFAPAVRAQHTQDNAVSGASDAFGKSVGSEKTGLYGSDDVRGFSPVDAGNARIEGLYFDQIDRLSQRLMEGSTVHVGISAQHYPFPAPTGIVDLELTKPGAGFEASLDGEYGEYGGPRYALDAKLPLDGERLGLSIGTGGRHQEQAEGGSARFRNVGALLAWQPYTGAQVMAFGGAIWQRSDEARATYFPAGPFAPPKIPRRVFLGQPWASRDLDIANFGLIAKLPMGGFRLEAGLFRSQRKTFVTYADLLTGVAQDGSVASRTVIADGNNLDRSTSGEVRLSREWGQGALRHNFAVNIRGRIKDRDFGGTQKIALGPSSALVSDFRAKPAIVLGRENEDRVRQITFGAAYGLNWADRGAIDVSVAQSRYRKQVHFADPLVADVVTRDRPLLWSVSGSLILSSRLAFYAGYAKGLEEALIAPDIASNRSEAPPAIRTRQIDAGLRYAVTPDLSLVAGIFSVRKPYYNLDSALRYRQLGTVESRGVEVSLAGTLRPGISLVAGTVLLDPAISGEAVAARLIGSRPVGSLTRRSVLNLDWRLGAGKGPLSLDLAVESYSARTANSANSFVAPARSSVTLGGRYRFDLASAKAMLRVQAFNLFDQYGWNVSSSGGFTYTGGRTVTVQLVVDL